MPKCLNDSTKRYTGDENTPKGRGYTASAEKLGTRKKGTDGRMYVVTKAGSYKKWSLVKSKSNKNNSNNMLSPMARKKNKKKKQKKVTFYDDDDDEDEGYYTEDEDYDDLEWKLEAAEERCRLSDFFCTETLLVNVALLAWNYFKDWYRRVRHGEDPYRVLEDIQELD